MMLSPLQMVLLAMLPVAILSMDAGVDESPKRRFPILRRIQSERQNRKTWTENSLLASFRRPSKPGSLQLPLNEEEEDNLSIVPVTGDGVTGDGEAIPDSGARLGRNPKATGTRLFKAESARKISGIMNLRTSYNPKFLEKADNISEDDSFIVDELRNCEKIQNFPLVSDISLRKDLISFPNSPSQVSHLIFLSILSSRSLLSGMVWRKATLAQSTTGVSGVMYVANG